MNTHTYIELFQNLNVNKTGSKSAPHKPILLLSIMDLIETGQIDAPFIPISDILQHRFKQNWKRYVSRSSGFNCAMQYPFYHLSSSPFWHLRRTSDYVESAPTSMKALKKSYVGADIDQALFNLMQDPRTREELRAVLITTYLSNNGLSIAAEPLVSIFGLLSMLKWMALNA